MASSARLTDIDGMDSLIATSLSGNHAGARVMSSTGLPDLLQVHERSAIRLQARSGRNCSQVTAPPVDSSIPGHMPGGIGLSRRSHSLTVGCETPRASAKADWLPASLMASLSASMRHHIGNADANASALPVIGDACPDAVAFFRLREKT